MSNLYIEQTKSTPRIQFEADSNKLRIEGQSYPENAFKFYEPVFPIRRQCTEIVNCAGENTQRFGIKVKGIRFNFENGHDDCPFFLLVIIFKPGSPYKQNPGG